MRKLSVFAAVGTSLAAFLTFTGTAFAHDLTGTPIIHPCSPDSPQAGVELTLVNFPAGQSEITLHGTVNGTGWTATSTLTGPHGTVVFDIPETATAGTGTLHLEVTGVSWAADGGRTIPLTLVADMICHQPKPVTPPSTVKPPVVQHTPPAVPPAQIGTPAVLTKPATPAVAPAVTQPSGPSLAYTGAAETIAEVLLGLSLVAVGGMLVKRHGTSRSALLTDE